ncbi:hypothetical protein MHU86_13987 [Fragilaria crotonensis]|nr:hypothetical protein MHU86_13987 [Fragilaria crotonensis]
MLPYRQWSLLTILLWGAGYNGLMRTILRIEAYSGTTVFLDARVSSRSLVRRLSHHCILCTSKQVNNDDVNKDDDDDDDDTQSLQPYRNRSLAWTNKYRALLPYEQARSKVIAMGFYSKSDWDDYVSDGSNGPYLPNHPDEMYAADWVSWEEFLGLMRDHDDARHVVQHVLQVTTLEDYTNFIQADPKRAEHLRIPLKPHVVYRDKGWISYDHFFGTMQ